jgi:hypothetical protein
MRKVLMRFLAIPVARGSPLVLRDCGFAPRKKGSDFAPLCVLLLSALPAGSPSGSLIVWQLTPQWKLCHWK